MDNDLNVLNKLLELVKVKKTNTFLKENLLSHADYPSLISISDTLEKYNIQTLAVKIKEEKLEVIPLPCIIQVYDKGEYFFYILTKIEANNVTVYNQNNKILYISKDTFLEVWTGICLLIEITPTTKEPGIEARIKRRKIINTLLIFLGILFSSWLAFEFIQLWSIKNSTQSLFYLTFTFLKIIGLSTSVLLLWYEVDKYNPTLQNFCSGGVKVDCDQVLSSKYAYIFKKTISVSAITFSYFFATLVLLLFTNFSDSSITILSILSITSIPILLYSLYIQGIIVRSWCKFCIGLGGILIVEFALTYVLNGISFGQIRLSDIIFFSLLFSAPILIWLLLKPVIEKAKEGKIVKKNLQKIKFNKSIFETLLFKSTKINHNFKDVGILLKNQNPKYHVLKVCNPYCPPCARAHPILEKLYQDGIIDLQILFTATTDENDYKYYPVSHLLAIDTQNALLTHKALDDWYRASVKDYASFSKKYPLNIGLKSQNAKIEKMQKWCEDENITHTPSIFINGYKLTKDYAISDLSELLY